MALSGLQRQVLALYRRAWRAARTKHASGTAEGSLHDLQQYVRAEFEQHRHLPGRPGNLMKVEHLLRQGARKLEVMSRPEVSGVTLVGPRGGGAGASGGSVQQ